MTSLTDAGVVTVGVTDLADAGMAFPADIAGVVTVGVASLADAGMVTVGMTDLTDARAASLADAGMALQADIAGVVTIGVASLADAGLVTVGVTDLADARAATLADPAGHVGGGMTDLGVQARVRIEEMPLLPDCAVRDCDVIDDPEYIDSQMSCDDCVSAGIWCQEMPLIHLRRCCLSRFVLLWMVWFTGRR